MLDFHISQKDLHLSIVYRDRDRRKELENCWVFQMRPTHISLVCPRVESIL